MPPDGLPRPRGPRIVGLTGRSGGAPEPVLAPIRVDKGPDSVDNRDPLWTVRPPTPRSTASRRGRLDPTRTPRCDPRLALHRSIPRGRPVETGSGMCTALSTAAPGSRGHRPLGDIGRPPRPSARPRGPVHRVHTIMSVMTGWRDREHI